LRCRCPDDDAAAEQLWLQLAHLTLPRPLAPVASSQKSSTAWAAVEGGTESR
jgi:hypothetical protein